MKALIPPKKNLITYLKTDNLAGEIYKALLLLSLGYYFSSNFSYIEMILYFVVIVSLMAIIQWCLSQYLYRKPISINEKSLSIRGEHFNLEKIEYLTYTQNNLPNDDVLKIKIRGYQERHICIYEKFYREELRLYHFLKHNFMQIELKKGA